MEPVVIQAQDVSKCYRLGVIGRDALMNDAAAAWQRIRGRSGKPALPDPHAENATRKIAERAMAFISIFMNSLLKNSSRCP